MNKYFEQEIRIKLLKINNEQITKADLDTITELGISNRTFSNESKDIELSLLESLHNLEHLTLQYFDLKDNEMSILSSLEKLKSLQISSCQISTNDLHEFKELENLVISTSRFEKFPKVVVPKFVTLNGIDQAVNLKEVHGIEQVEELRLTNIKKIKNLNVVKEMPELKSLNIDGSKIDNKRVVDELKKKIPVSHEEESFLVR